MMPRARLVDRTHAKWALASFVVLSCDRVPEPEPGFQQEQSAAIASASGSPAGAKSPRSATLADSKPSSDPAAVATDTDTARGGDPENGDYTLQEALKGLPGTGSPKARIETDLGALNCELYDDRAPVTVANFVGLARGTRPWKNTKGDWVKAPAYDGTVFHRIIKGFMIQGGDAEGTGRGGPGYVFKDEVWDGAKHDRRGLLCMANRGANTNGAQFFILDGPAPHLDRGYTIFGQCGPDALIEKLASVPVVGERPTKAPVIKHVAITRK